MTDFVGVPSARIARVASYIRRVLVTCDADTLVLSALEGRDEVELGRYVLRRDVEPDDLAREIAVTIESDSDAPRFRLHAMRGEAILTPTAVIASNGKTRTPQTPESKDRFTSDLVRSHNDLVRLLVTMAANQSEAANRTIALAQARDETRERVLSDALDRYVSARRADVLNAAEADRLAAETDAIKRTANLLVENIPDAIKAAKAHFVAKAGEHPVAKLGADFMRSLTPEQVQAFAATMTPAQKKAFADLWQAAGEGDGAH